MRRLLLLRHAKADWPPGLDDHDRPLTPRGIEAAETMGRYLREAGLIPDRAIVSTARRTRDTWALVKRQFGREVPESFEAGAYLASPDKLAGFARALPDTVCCVLLVGHNPGCEDLAVRATGSGDKHDIARMLRKYPTCGLAVLDFPDGWRGIGPGLGRLERFVTPSSLAKGAAE